MSQPYLSLEAQLHDAFWDAEDDASEVPLMADFLKNHPGPALEVGAGSGRLLFPLLEMGYPVEGLELSPDMLQLAEIRASQLSLHSPIHLGDMATWDASGRKFSALLAPAFTLQLASNTRHTLHHWHSLLTPQGGLYLTLFMPYAELLGDLPENRWYQDHQVTLPDGRTGLLQTRHQLDRKRQLVKRQHRYTLSGTPPLTHHSKQTIRWYEHSQTLALLQECGFHINHCLLDFDPTLVAHTSPASPPSAVHPDNTDFTGILTYHATRMEIP